MVQTSSSNKNLWVASSDGDLERVQYLIESEGMSPNDKDSNSYTPMHAAASYAHLELLTYLLSKGGNINIPDDDGETPLFVVETLDAAKFLIENGAEVGWKNEEGLSAADQLSEDQPEISEYLYSLLPESERPPSSLSQNNDNDDEEGEEIDVDEIENPDGISSLALENFTEEQSNYLMAESEKIMKECHEKGEQPDEKLQELVENIIKNGLNFAKNAQAQSSSDIGNKDLTNGDDSKRIREE
ncbi:uncharacterized protein L201_004980 [Kwoniella dendrophila CBS 6074]|uniref:Ankyrin repeat-containing protein n=1 Tax=Kwoniella dendrophila CBS 6074 TaxID=1295534 RepID=A0AAX4JYV7_9TREE